MPDARLPKFARLLSLLLAMLLVDVLGSGARAQDAPQSLPDGWTWHSAHGLSLALPGEMLREVAPPTDEMLSVDALFVTEPAQGRVQSRVVVTFATPRQMRLPGRLGETTAQTVARELSEEFPFEIREIEQTVMMLGQIFDVLQGGRDPAAGAKVDMTVFVGRELVGRGYLPLISVLHFNRDDDEAARMTEMIRASLRPADGMEIGTPEPRVFEGVVQIRVPPGGRWHEPGRIGFADGPRGMPERARIDLIQLGPPEDATARFITSRFAEPPVARMADHGGVPVWVLEGRPLHVPVYPVQRSTPDGPWVQRSLVTRVCPPRRGPVTVSAIVRTDRPSDVPTFDALLSGAVLTLPETSAPCPEEQMAPLAALAVGEPVVTAPVEPSSPSTRLGAISEVIDLMGGAIRLSVPQGGRVRYEELLIREMPDRPVTAALRAFMTGPTTDDVARFLRDRFDGPIAARADTVGGVPVWRVEGRPRYVPGTNQRTEESSDWQQMALVTRLCSPRYGALAVTAATGAARDGSGLTLDELVTLVDFVPGGDYVECDARMQQPLADLPDPAQP